MLKHAIDLVTEAIAAGGFKFVKPGICCDGRETRLQEYLARGGDGRRNRFLQDQMFMYLQSQQILQILFQVVFDCIQ
jgi:hypothetical protein